MNKHILLYFYPTIRCVPSLFLPFSERNMYIDGHTPSPLISPPVPHSTPPPFPRKVVKVSWRGFISFQTLYLGCYLGEWLTWFFGQKCCTRAAIFPLQWISVTVLHARRGTI